MARFLIVVPPLAGHINPTLPIGRYLIAAGHDLAWVGCSRRVRALLPADLPLIGIEEKSIADTNENWLARASSVSGLESFKFFYEEFLVPLAHAMLPGVLKAIREFSPDLMLCDQQALGGALAARLRGIPFATLATTPAAIFNPIAQFPKVGEWMIEILGQAQDRYGLERWHRPDLSKNLVLIASTEDLIGDHVEVPAHFLFVGPSIRHEVSQPAFPWDEVDPSKKKIYVSLGTVNADRSLKFYQKIKEAFTGTDYQLILAAPPDMLGGIPDNFIVQKQVPQLDILKEVDAVIFHGGHNTFCETLLHALPSIALPIKDDQPVIAQQLVRSGAGLRLHFERVKSADLFAAAERILTDDSFRVAARVMRDKLLSSGGACKAASQLIAMSRKQHTQEVGTLA